MNNEPFTSETSSFYNIIIDDDLLTCKILEDIIGSKAIVFDSAVKALQNAKDLNPEAIFLDVHLNERECGLDHIDQIKKIWPYIPLIVITGDKNDEVIARALSSGANDFLLKPFRSAEVHARLKVRKMELKQIRSRLIISIGDIKIDRKNNLISGPKGEYYLPQKEIEILVYLVNSYGIALPKSQLKSNVWGSIAVSDNAFDRKIFEVRKALKEVSTDTSILTKYKKGLMLQSKAIFDNDILVDDIKYKYINRETKELLAT